MKRRPLEHGWIARVAGIHDRLSMSFVHLHDREETQGWFEGAQLVDVRADETDRRGGRAHGRRHATTLAPVGA